VLSNAEVCDATTDDSVSKAHSKIIFNKTSGIKIWK